GFNDWSCRPSAAHPEPVVLLHGLGGNGPGNFSALGPYLASAGFCVYAPTYGETIPGVPVGGITPIPQSAAEIAAFIGRVLAATGAAKVDLAGHSEGGFQALYGPKFVPGEAATVARVVALAPPTPVGHIGLAYDTDVAQLVRNALDPAHPVPVTCTAGPAL